MRNNMARWMNGKRTLPLAPLLSDSICLSTSCLYRNVHTRITRTRHVTPHCQPPPFQSHTNTISHAPLTAAPNGINTTLHRFKIFGVKQSALGTECHTTQRSLLAVAHYNVFQDT
jgi:hypothetical protein